MSTVYDYAARPLTQARLEEIVSTIDGLKNEAAHDIEDKREIYEALVDLFKGRDIGDGE